MLQTQPTDARLTALLNETLGLAVVDTEYPEPIVMLPERPGVPRYDLGDQFLSGLQVAFQPKIAVEISNNAAQQPTCLANLAFERAPLSQLVVAAGGPPLPLTMSFEQPGSDRPLRRAEIWFGDLLFAQEEAIMVSRILEVQGVYVEMVDASRAGATRFRESYLDAELDLLWVASHAEFGHWQPDQTALVLASDKHVSLHEFAYLRPPGGDRRLLVLNACDGAAAASLAGHLGSASLLVLVPERLLQHSLGTGVSPASLRNAPAVSTVARHVAVHDRGANPHEAAMRDSITGH